VILIASLFAAATVAAATVTAATVTAAVAASASAQNQIMRILSPGVSAVTVRVERAVAGWYRILSSQVKSIHLHKLID